MHAHTQPVVTQHCVGKLRECFKEDTHTGFTLCFRSLTSTSMQPSFWRHSCSFTRRRPRIPGAPRVPMLGNPRWIQVTPIVSAICRNHLIANALVAIPRTCRPVKKHGLARSQQNSHTSAPASRTRTTEIFSGYPY